MGRLILANFDLSIAVSESETMPSTDIDGNVIVILSKEEAKRVYRRLETAVRLDEIEQDLLRKIERDLKL